MAKNIKVKWIAPFLILAFVSTSLRVSPSEYSDDEAGYLAAKGRGDYFRALAVLSDWSAGISEPAMIEINAFRTYELMIFPELFQKGIDVLERMRSGKTAADDHYLRQRIDVFLGRLYLKQGRLDKASSVMNGLGFMSFLAMGPFENGSVNDFDMQRRQEKEFIKAQTGEGKRGRVAWFPVMPNREGHIDFEEFIRDVKDSLFYLYGEFTVSREGEYRLLFGRTGFTDIWLDGTRIYSSRDRHGFCHDQYLVKVTIPQGDHSILVKTGDSHDGLMFTMRITDSIGAPVRMSGRYTRKNARELPGDTYGSSLFPTLNALVQKKEAAPEESFRAGYLFCMAGLCTPHHSDESEQFMKVPPGHAFFAAANYYLGRLQKTPEQREHFFRKSFSGSGNVESLLQMINIKVSHRFFYEAYPLIEELGKISAGSPLHRMSLAKFFEKKGWYHEMLKSSYMLKGSIYPSIGHSMKARYHIVQREFSQAGKELSHLYGRNIMNRDALKRMIWCHEKCGRFDLAEKLLNRAVNLFPNSTWYRLRLARLIGEKYGVQASIPYLSSVLKVFPDHKVALRELGIACHILGRDALARHYLSRASALDPDNFSLKTMLSSISGEKDELNEYLFSGSIPSLVKEADPYADEPAVVLLYETAVKLESNYSYEKRVRRVYRINSVNALEEFSNQYIIFDPKTESVENIRCMLIQGNRRFQITERYRKSLSDPESRLYYDLEALMIPVHGVDEGSILDFSYTVKNRSGNIYKNYYSEKISIGGNFRTLHTNIIVSCPRNKPLFNFMKDIDKKSLQVAKSGERKVYRIQIANRQPHKKESSMPHESDIAPAVYFSSMQSWSSVCSWYVSLLRDRLVLSDEMRRDLRNIVSAGDSTLEKIRKIYNHVTSQVRYVGFEFGLGGIQPRRTDETYHTKMGDCKDVALLLVVLLRAVGIDACIALVRTRDKGGITMSIPTLEEFNHALCYVNVDGGFFLDGTVPYVGIRELPSFDRNITALVIDERRGASSFHGGKSFAFINTDSQFYARDAMEIENDIIVHEDGSVEIKRKILKQGSLSYEARRTMNDPADTRERSLGEYWNKLFPGSKVADYKVLSSAIDSPAVYQYTVTIPSYAQVLERDIFVKPFCVKSEYYTNFAMTQNRSFPIQFSYIADVKTINRIMVPDGFRLSLLPKEAQFRDKNFTAHFSYSINNDVITSMSRVVIRSYQIGTKEYKRFREFARFVNNMEHGGIVLRKESSQ